MNANRWIRGSRRLVRWVRDAWLLSGLTVLLLVLVELALRAGFAAKDAAVRPGEYDPRMLVEAYGTADWPRDYFRELAQGRDRWEPYVYFRHRPFDGSFIHVDARGVRRTWEPARGGPVESTKVFVFGGSTAWGYGVRDGATIPSLLARELLRRGRSAVVTNLAEVGYVSTQDVIALLRALQAGERPDVVVFLDGANDTVSALQEGEAGIPMNESNRRSEFNTGGDPARLARRWVVSLVQGSALNRLARSVSQRFVGAPSSPRPYATGKSDRLAERVLTRYKENTRAVEALGERYGFSPRFYWQPSVFSKARPSVFELAARRQYGWAGPFFREVETRLSGFKALTDDPRFRSLTGLFDDEAGLVFIDHCHTTESANARLACAIADDVASLCRPLVPDSEGP